MTATQLTNFSFHKYAPPLIRNAGQEFPRYGNKPYLVTLPWEFYPRIFRSSTAPMCQRQKSVKSHNIVLGRCLMTPYLWLQTQEPYLYPRVSLLLETDTQSSWHYCLDYTIDHKESCLPHKALWANKKIYRWFFEKPKHPKLKMPYCLGFQFQALEDSRKGRRAALCSTLGQQDKHLLWCSAPLEGPAHATHCPPPPPCTPRGPHNSHIPAMPTTQGGQWKHRSKQWHPDRKKQQWIVNLTLTQNKISWASIV